MKKQQNLTQSLWKNQLVAVGMHVTQILDLVYEDFKAAITNVLKML